jgi:WD40 repeat protein
MKIVSSQSRFINPALPQNETTRPCSIPKQFEKSVFDKKGAQIRAPERATIVRAQGASCEADAVKNQFFKLFGYRTTHLSLKLILPLIYNQNFISSQNISYSETQLQSLRANSRTITRIPSSDGRDLIAFMQADTTIEIWDCNTKKIQQQPIHNYIPSTCFAYCEELSNNQGFVLAVGTAKGLLQLWNTSNGKIIAEYPFGDTPITDVVNLTNGKLAINMKTSSLSIWDYNQRAEIALIDTGSPICCINYLKGNLVACGLENGEFQVWDWNKQELVFSSVIYDNIPASCFCMPSDHTLLVGTTLGDIRFFDFDNPLPYLTVFTGVPLSICLMDEEHVLFGNADGVNILNVESGFYRFIQGNDNYYGTYGLCAPDSTGSFVTGASNYNSGNTLNNLIKYTPSQSSMLMRLTHN